MTDEAKRIVANEVWEASARRVERLFGSGIGRNSEPFAETLSDAEATIAACAPEALKLLLTLEWASREYSPTTYGCDDEGPCCAFCEANKERGDEHTSDCHWLALMKKAKLRK